MFFSASLRNSCDGDTASLGYDVEEQLVVQRVLAG
jgi:hypothetical protein